MVFTIYGATLVLALAAFAVLAGLFVPRSPGLASKVTRDRWLGGLLGLVCLSWSGHHILLMMEGGMARYHNLALVLLAALGLLCFFFLDYLLVRALGGVLILSINAALHGAFVVELPFRGGFAALCYALALGAMVMVAVPWRVRHLLEHAAESTTWRRTLSTVASAAAAVVLVYLLMA